VGVQGLRSYADSWAELGVRAMGGGPGGENGRRRGRPESAADRSGPGRDFTPNQNVTLTQAVDFRLLDFRRGPRNKVVMGLAGVSFDAVLLHDQRRARRPRRSRATRTQSALI